MMFPSALFDSGGGGGGDTHTATACVAKIVQGTLFKKQCYPFPPRVLYVNCTNYCNFCKYNCAVNKN